MINYGFSGKAATSFDETIILTEKALASEGFGVLTRINLKEKFKEKLDAEIENYVILGACNPTNAFRAVREEYDIGLLLPCNVIIYEKEGQVTVSIIKPTVMMGMVPNPELSKIAKNIEERLGRVFNAVAVAGR